MFEELTELGGGELLAAMSTSLRVERAAMARRLVSAGLLIERRIADSVAETQYWAVEDWDVCAAEIGVELGISRHRASADMNYGQTLVVRFPALAQRALAGDVDFRVIAVIELRTRLVGDPDVLAKLDAILARSAPGWNGLSQKRLVEVIDWEVIALDPEAQRVPAHPDVDRYIEITPGQNGIADISGRIDALRGAALDKRLDQMAGSVCPEDPRTHEQRRLDALAAFSEDTTFGCGCGSQDCPTAATSPVAGSQVVIHVLAEQSTVTGTGATPGYVVGYGPIPAHTVAGAAQTAKLTPAPISTATEAGYRPSKKLAEFVAFRDMGCRWPGCNAPIERCDIDHTVPWPWGPTHPSNTKAYCRHHHLMKTFWTGPNGFTDTQHPDGTITLTTPTGRSYSTTPFGARFFPQLASATGSSPTRGEPPPHDATKMPRRTHTRAAARAARIAHERAQRRAIIEADPPPF